MGRPPCGRSVTRCSGRTSWPPASSSRAARTMLASTITASCSAEGCADADARPRPERQIGEAVDGGAPVRHEAVGIERLRRLPQKPVPVQHPGRGDHQRALRDAHVADAVLAERRAAHERHRRVKADRLVDDGAGEDEAGKVVRGEARARPGPHRPRARPARARPAPATRDRGTTTGRWRWSRARRR